MSMSHFGTSIRLRDFQAMSARPGRKSLHTPAYGKILALLKQMREEAGLTQEELAKRLKRTRTYVTKCELGERRIDVLEWLQFCRGCEADPVAALTKIRKAIRT
jgi:DNA-binding XRE family transcriptional regulator